MAEGWIEPALFRQFETEGTNAHRIYSGGWAWAERLGGDVLISHKTDAACAAVLAELRDWARALGWDYRRVFARFLPKQNAEREAPRLLEGDAQTSAESIVTERRRRFGIDFAAGYSAGLFLDQRANRAELERLEPRRVLNCFAYTCSFSVVAAATGANTWSVDLSKKSLARGRENFALNGIDPATHRFLADDVLELLPRLARRGEEFDAIVLDPPTFSRSHRGRAFQVERDLETLLLAGLEVAAPGAHMLVSTNCTTISDRDLERMARFCLKATRRSGQLRRMPPLPDFPAGAAARTLWMALR